MDKELKEYRQKVGTEEYRRQYYQLYSEAKQSSKRYSGKEYINSQERISQIKDKYKNGVTNAILNEFVKGI